MGLRDIVLIDNAKLRDKSKKVKQFGPNPANLIKDMIDTLHASKGVGLAAPQIGVLLRVIVAEIPKEEGVEDPNVGKTFVLVNPEIVKASPEMVEAEEGCLSIPTWYGLVNRHEWITIKGQDGQGKPKRIKADGYLGRIFQHELDHLDGILFIDHITDPEKIWQVVPEEDKELATVQS